MKWIFFSIFIIISCSFLFSFFKNKETIDLSNLSKVIYDYSYIDIDGNVVDEEGEYKLDFSPFLDDSGDPVPVPAKKEEKKEEEVKSEEKKEQAKNARKKKVSAELESQE